MELFKIFDHAIIRWARSHLDRSSLRFQFASSFWTLKRPWTTSAPKNCESRCLNETRRLNWSDADQMGHSWPELKWKHGKCERIMEQMSFDSAMEGKLKRPPRNFRFVRCLEERRQFCQQCHSRDFMPSLHVSCRYDRHYSPLVFNIARYFCNPTSHKCFSPLFLRYYSQNVVILSESALRSRRQSLCQPDNTNQG
jgi:hypothetical protein